MTILQLVQLLGALTSLGLNADKLVELVKTLHAEGVSDADEVPPRHIEALRAALTDIGPRPGTDDPRTEFLRK